MRQLIKIMNAAYNEKMIQGKEVLGVKLQGMMEFVYDSHINKYGLLNVAERKLKEMLLTVMLHRTKSVKIELFARFLGVSEVTYTPDDLEFLFGFAQLLLLKFEFFARNYE